jgi:creatinine amidohydrolase/Fe(II)-dependent formamide hydrolase-like protein
LRPELVRIHELRDQPTALDRELLRYMPFKKISPRTFMGRPTQATADQGRRALDFIVERTIASLRATLRKVAAVRGKR